MVVDKKKNMLTARKYPNMVLIEVNVKDSVLTLSYPGMEDISVKVPETTAVTNTPTDVFGEKCEGVDLGDKTGNWLSEVYSNQLLKMGMIIDTNQPQPKNKGYASPSNQQAAAAQ